VTGSNYSSTTTSSPLMQWVETKHNSTTRRQ
jgi:hypothetical protein